MASLHANSAREAVVKCCTLPLLAGENISADKIPRSQLGVLKVLAPRGADGDGLADSAALSRKWPGWQSRTCERPS